MLNRQANQLRQSGNSCLGSALGFEVGQRKADRSADHVERNALASWKPANVEVFGRAAPSDSLKGHGLPLPPQLALDPDRQVVLPLPDALEGGQAILEEDVGASDASTQVDLCGTEGCCHGVLSVSFSNDSVGIPVALGFAISQSLSETKDLVGVGSIAEDHAARTRWRFGRNARVPKLGDSVTEEAISPCVFHAHHYDVNTSACQEALA